MTADPRSRKCCQWLRSEGYKFEVFQLDCLDPTGEAHRALQQLTGKQLAPYAFVEGKCVGGTKELREFLRGTRAEELSTTSTV